LNPPALPRGYRLEADGAVLVYATDHEPHSRALAAGDSSDIGGEDRRHVELLTGADLVIHDAQYVAAEYPEKAGWGHSTMESVVASARAAGARRLALYHHDPLRDDAAIERLAVAARGQAAAAGGGLGLCAAAEGLVIDIAPTGAAPEASRLAQVAAEAEVPAELLTQTVLVAVDDPSFRDGLVEAGRAGAPTAAPLCWP